MSQRYLSKRGVFPNYNCEGPFLSYQLPKLTLQLIQPLLLSFQLEDAEFSAQSALKAKKKLEEDVADFQGQVDALSKSKKEVRQV